MIVAGVDVGVKNVKVVLFDDSQLKSQLILPVGMEPVTGMVEKALADLSRQANLAPGDIQRVLATGYGAFLLPYPRISDSICLARGAYFVRSSCGTAMDIGAQRSMAASCTGGVCTKFSANGKCAVGSGMFLEAVANVLRLKLEDMANLPSQGDNKIQVSSMCVVFAESEIISLVHEGAPVADIVRGAVNALAAQIYPLLVQVGMARDVLLCGGVARSRVLVAALQELIGFEAVVAEQPEFVPAYGAALIATERREWS